MIKNKMPLTFLISSIQSIATSIAVKNPHPYSNSIIHCLCIAQPLIVYCVGLNTSIDLYPHWLGLYGQSWPPHFNPFAPFATQYEHCKDKVRFKVYCVSFSAAKQESTPCHHDTVACHPSGICPSKCQGKFLKVIWHEWVFLVQGWPQHLRFRLCRSFIARSSACGVKVLSSWRFIASVWEIRLWQAKSFSLW